MGVWCVSVCVSVLVLAVVAVVAEVAAGKGIIKRTANVKVRNSGYGGSNKSESDGGEKIKKERIIGNETHRRTLQVMVMVWVMLVMVMMMRMRETKGVKTTTRETRTKLAKSGGNSRGKGSDE